jgi:hypothetical protein
MTQLAKGRIGQASKGTTTISLFQPAFSNDYFNDPTTGTARLCGTGAADTTPWQYAFGGFTLVGGKFVMNTTPVFSQQLLPSTAARCTGWTEVFNPNIGAGGTDFFFFGLTADCTGAGTSGCVKARNANGSLSSANIAGGRAVLWSTTSVPRRRHPVFTSRVPQHPTPRTSLHRTDCSKENTKGPAAGSPLQESAAGPFPPDSRTSSSDHRPVLLCRDLPPPVGLHQR